ncbi:NAD(P)-dependent oxidoreductase [Streptomyces sp. NPDC013178]|uniref:NAD(P)-dependent oxidoreductase n=1 Tax=Streptomyces sp. NPDC013178 TaxID=3155118 RepID=UPI0033DB677B
MTDNHVVWLPFKLPQPDATAEDPANSLTIHYWDGSDTLPSDPAEVRFLVPPPWPGRDADLLEFILPKAQSLDVLQLLSSGYDSVRPWLPKLAPTTRVATARGVHAEATAELAVALLLAQVRGIDVFHRQQARHQWRQSVSSTLVGKTVLVLGQGAVGRAVASRLTAFGCRTVRVARTGRDTSDGRVHPVSDLPKLLPSVDAVVLCAPLTAETHGLFGADALSRLRTGAVLVNVARGEIVDTPSLVAQVEAGRLRAALDVVAPEPLPADHPLWDLPGVLLTPHTAVLTDAFTDTSSAFLAEQLARYARGEELMNVLPPAAGEPKDA